MTTETLETRVIDACAVRAMEVVQEYASLDSPEELAGRVAFETAIAGTNIVRRENGLEPIRTSYDEAEGDE